MIKFAYFRNLMILFCLMSIMILLFRRFKQDSKYEKSRKFFEKYKIINKDMYQKYQPESNLENDKKLLDAKNNAKNIEYDFNLEKLL